MSASTHPRNSAGQTVEVAAFERAGVTLDLLDGVTVVGTALFADGSPAQVKISSRPTLDEDAHFSHCEVREDGSYVLPYQPRRSFFVVASFRAEVVANREIIEPAPGVVRCDFVIEGLQTLRGRVVADDGRELAGWHVSAAETSGRERETFTAADGSFVFQMPNETTCTLTAAAPHATHRPLVTLEQVRGADRVELRVPTAMLPRASVRGRLVAAEGAPAEAHSLVLVAMSEMSIEQRPTRLLIHHRRAELRTRTAVDGTFVFTDLGEDRYALGCYFGGNQLPLRVDLELATAQQLELGDLVLPTMATLLVEFVHEDGRPWSGDIAGITLRNADGDEVIVDHAHDDRGLRLTVEPGVYQLSLRATDLITPPSTVTLTGGATTRQRVPLTIGRTCLLKFNGDGAARPEARARLQVVVRDPAGAVVHQSDARHASDLRGFRYWTLRTTLPFGRYEAEATGDDGLRYRGSFELGADIERSTDFDLPQQR